MPITKKEKETKKKRIKAGLITHVSLCPSGANNIEQVYKEDTGGDSEQSPMTFNNMRSALEGLLETKYATEDNYVYVRDFALDWVIFRSSNKLWKVGYNLSLMTLVGEPVEVAEGSVYFEITTVSKEAENFDDEGLLTCCVYAPDQFDAEGHIADGDAIQTMIHSFGKNGKGIDVRHNLEVLDKEAVYVAESFTIQKDDPRFAEFKNKDGENIDVTGGWGMVLKIDDPEIRKNYREGAWKGVSLFGTCLTQEIDDTGIGTEEIAAEAVTDESVPADAEEKLNFLQKLASWFNLSKGKDGDWNITSKNKKPKNEELDVDAKDLAAAIAESNKPLLEALGTMAGAMETLSKEVKGQAPEAKTDEVKDTKSTTTEVAKSSPTPEEKDFDPSTLDTPEKVAAYQKKLRIEKLQKSTDWDDVASVQKFQDALKLEQDMDPSPETEEVVDAFDAHKSYSQQRLSKSTPETEATVTPLEEDPQVKQDAEAFGYVE